MLETPLFARYSSLGDYMMNVGFVNPSTICSHLPSRRISHCPFLLADVELASSNNNERGAPSQTGSPCSPGAREPQTFSRHIPSKSHPQFIRQTVSQSSGFCFSTKLTKRLSSYKSTLWIRLTLLNEFENSRAKIRVLRKNSPCLGQTQTSRLTLILFRHKNLI